MDSIGPKNEREVQQQFRPLKEAMGMLKGKNFGELLFEFERLLGAEEYWFDDRERGGEMRMISLGELVHWFISKVPDEEFDAPRWNIFVDTFRDKMLGIGDLELILFGYLEKQKRTYDLVMATQGGLYGQWKNQYYKHGIGAYGEVIKRERDCGERDIAAVIREGFDERQYDLSFPSKVSDAGSGEKIFRLFTLELIVSDYMHRRYGKDKIVELGKECLDSMMLQGCYSNAIMIGLVSKRLKEGFIRRASVLREDIYKDLWEAAEELQYHLVGLFIEKRSRDKANQEERERRAKMVEERDAKLEAGCSVDLSRRDFAKKFALVAGGILGLAIGGGAIYSAFERRDGVGIESVGHAQDLGPERAVADDAEVVVGDVVEEEMVAEEVAEEVAEDIGPVDAENDVEEDVSIIPIKVKERVFGGYKIDERISKQLWEAKGYKVKTRVDFGVGKKYYLLQIDDKVVYEIAADTKVVSGQEELTVEGFSR